MENKSPYRTNDVPQFVVEKRTLWQTFLDRTVGFSCTCPDCFGRKRPRLFSKNHLWSDYIPKCLFGKHEYISTSQYKECIRCSHLVPIT